MGGANGVVSLVDFFFFDGILLYYYCCCWRLESAGHDAERVVSETRLDKAKSDRGRQPMQV